jgi:hypothetical protein
LLDTNQRQPTTSSISHTATRSESGLLPSESTGKPSPEAALGNTTKYVEKRGRNFALQGCAARLLPKERVHNCLWSLAYKAGGVQILKRKDRARFNGLQLCGSVWHCPVCSARISEVRRQELNKALEWSRAEDIIEGSSVVFPVMMTLTARHKRADRLRVQLDGMKNAKRRLRQSHTWRLLKMQVEGTITATEVTHGKNGWHTHFHELVFVAAGSNEDACAIVEQLRSVWLQSLAKVGLSGGKAAFDVQGAGKAGEYISKWGAGEEMTLREMKTGAGLTPFQLLEAAKCGDKPAAGLFTEYALSFKGRRQLIWSNGFKKRVGIGEVEDDEAAAGEAEDELLDEIIAEISPDSWRKLRACRIDRAALLREAERGGFDAVEQMITDCLSRSPPH